MARDDLALAPTTVYRAKAALTHLRSWRWRLRRRPPAPGLRILFYHRVSRRPRRAGGRRRTASPSRWRCLARDGLRAVDVEEAARAARRRASRGHRRPVLRRRLRGRRAHAVPVLERHGFRATRLPATGVIDGTRRLHLVRGPAAAAQLGRDRALDRGGTLRFGPTPSPTRTCSRSTRRRRARRSPARRPRSRSASGTRSAPSAIRRGCSARASGGWSPRPDSPWPRRASPGSTARAAIRWRCAACRSTRATGCSTSAPRSAGGHDAPPALRATYRRLRFGASASARS